MTTIQPLPVQVPACLPRDRQSIALSWRTRVLRLFLCAAGVVSALLEAGAASEGSTARLSAEPGRAIRVGRGNSLLVESPPEGLWSVATDWTNGWPAGWMHAQPAKVWDEGDWVRVSGQLDLAQGRLELLDSYRIEGDVVRGVRRFTWRGNSELPRCTLSVRWVVPGATHAKPLLPGIVYYGNPSGARTGAGAVAVHAGVSGDMSLFEEHRYGAPFACLEWAAAGSFRSAALHTVPSRVGGGHHADQWWSLGVIAREACAELTLLSGPCAANGQPSVAKALQ